MALRRQVVGSRGSEVGNVMRPPDVAVTAARFFFSFTRRAARLSMPRRPSGVSFRISTPRSAIETSPVSSETTRTTASDSLDYPTAARWRLPSSRSSVALFRQRKLHARIRDFALADHDAKIVQRRVRPEIVLSSSRRSALMRVPLRRYRQGRLRAQSRSVRRSCARAECRGLDQLLDLFVHLAGPRGTAAFRQAASAPGEAPVERRR